MGRSARPRPATSSASGSLDIERLSSMAGACAGSPRYAQLHGSDGAAAACASGAQSEAPPLPRRSSWRRRTCWLRLAGVALLAGAALAVGLTLGRRDTLAFVLLFVHRHAVGGVVIFSLLYILFTVLFLPPALLAACAGALWGFAGAAPIVWVCAMAGETLSFLLGRFMLRRWVAELTREWPMWLALNAALSEDGWKLVLLLRLSPAIPFSLVNYALGTSSLPFASYFWPSVVGVLPSLAVYIWLGSLAADVGEAVAGGGSSVPPAARAATLAVCAVSAIGVVVASAVYTKRAIDRRLAGVQIREEVCVQQHHLLAGHQRRPSDGGSSRSSCVGSSSGGRSLLVLVETPVLVATSSGSQQGRAGGGWPGWPWARSTRPLKLSDAGEP